MKAEVLVECTLAHEFPDFQLGKCDPLLHPFQLGTSTAGAESIGVNMTFSSCSARQEVH